MSQSVPSSPAGSSLSITPILPARPETGYVHRAARLRALPERDPALSPYLLFAARIVEAQHSLLQSDPLPPRPVEASSEEGALPIDIPALLQEPDWQRYLDALLKRLSGEGVSDEVRATLCRLQELGSSERIEAARSLLNGDASLAGSDGAPFIWAAVSLCAAQRAAQYAATLPVPQSAIETTCPLCGGAPVASIVHLVEQSGLRYLHCSLCETEWHVVRSQCSNCGASGEVSYWSIDTEDSSAKAESCGSCNTYLKVFTEKADNSPEPVADDLASLALDFHMEEEGFARSGINPFLFAGTSP